MCIVKRLKDLYLGEFVQMGDANASIPTVQPVLPRPMWGANPASAALNSVSFVSQVSIELGMIEIGYFSIAVEHDPSSRHRQSI